MRLIINSLLLTLFFSVHSYAQWTNDFLNIQKTNAKVNAVYNKKMDSIALLCSQKGIAWPIEKVYLRAFKLDNAIEVWVKDNVNPRFQYLKTYKVCSSNGKLGPKRKEGDKQVPEGFYFINQFNPNSNYHLSLGINYPNTSDKILADAVRPGGSIYIHGDCVSVGCLAINDEQIEDLYLISAVAKSMGQEYVPVHIFPTKFNVYKSKEIIQKLAIENEDYIPFIKAMQSVFFYFEKEKELPAILINNKGQYVIQDVEIPVIQNNIITNLPKILIAHKIRKYSTNELANAVDNNPVFNGGNAAYLSFVKSISAELSYYLTDKQNKAFITTEFIVNTDGTVSNVEIKKGGNEDLNEALKTKLENTTDWTPATKDLKAVAFKMTQTFFIEMEKK
jgi:murein L,D-transpeptidase YafK